MRIISGAARGRRLATPTDDAVRPTSDRIRESLFSILGDVRELRVIDAFAGTGALGCEALSRGAARCDFFDASKASIALVHENVSRIQAGPRAHVHHGPFASSVLGLSHQADLVFIDPPYATTLAQEALDALLRAGALAPQALLVVEQDHAQARCVVDAALLQLRDERRYGRTRLCFYTYLGEPPVAAPAQETP